MIYALCGVTLASGIYGLILAKENTLLRNERENLLERIQVLNGTIEQMWREKDYEKETYQYWGEDND